MRAKFVNEFERGVDPKKALGIGRVGKIEKLFRDFDVSNKFYDIIPTGVIFKGNLDLQGLNVTWLPDGLKISGVLDLSDTPIAELPNGLKMYINLILNNTNITKLPDDLEIIRGNIYVNQNQTELISFIQNSKFAGQLIINR